MLLQTIFLFKCGIHCRLDLLPIKLIFCLSIGVERGVIFLFSCYCYVTAGAFYVCADDALYTSKRISVLM